MKIRIHGAHEHNLHGVDVEFGGGLTVVTGISGSGKTSLVFDTLYHEARRRFLDVFELGSPKGRLSPALVESIEGLGPAVAVGQNLLNRNPASTLATASGLHPFLRLFYTHFGERTCTRCKSPLLMFTEEETVSFLLAQAKTSSIRISALLLHGVTGSHRTLLSALRERFDEQQILVDGHVWRGQKLETLKQHTIELQISEFSKGAGAGRLRECVQQAAALDASTIVVRWPGGAQTLSQAPVCTTCGTWFGNLRPADFHSACPYCNGEGCRECNATGLRPQAAAVRWSDLTFPQLLRLTVD